MALAVLVTLGSTAPVVAQDADSSVRARALFAEGVQLSMAGQLVEAEARFREALTLHDAPSIRYNLANVLMQRGAFPEAHSLSEGVVADPTSSAEIRQLASALTTQIAERAGYLRVTMVGTGQVAVDGWTLSDPSLEVPVAPGTHTATVTRARVAVAHAEVSVETGQHRAVELDAREAPVALEVPPEALAPAPVAEAPVTEQWWFWAGIVTTVVGAAVVISVVAVTTNDAPMPAYQGNFEPGVLHW